MQMSLPTAFFLISFALLEILQTRMPTLPMISENPVLLKLLQEVMVIKKMPDGAIRRPRRKTGVADVEQEEEEGTRDKDPFIMQY